MLLRSFLLALLPALVAVGQLTSVASAATGPCPAKPGWDDGARPAHIFGNTWYVGTCGISAILITSPRGHVLLDGATTRAATLIEANIRALGFKVEDIRYILSSHEHLDHAGGIARIQMDSRAIVVAREPAATTLELGENDRSDPQFGLLGPFTPISRVRRIGEGESIEIGKVRVTAHATPGHTAGSTSWTWRSCESEGCLHMVYADSLSAISAEGYRFSDEEAHPGELARFRKSLELVADLPCDILMTPHPGASHLLDRLGPGATAALVDPGACVRYAQQAAMRLDARLDQENLDARK